MYKKLFKFLLKLSKPLKIIIVGANDGKINDPSYNLIMKNAQKTQVLLVEPNTALISVLKENYRKHPSFEVANCAIGSNGIFQLFIIKEAWWPHFRPSYAEGWPVYRAATGVTSATKSNVEEALTRQGLDPKVAMGVINVPFKPLSELCRELNWKTPIDILQVDVEGHDDRVIYESNIDLLRPKLILFESHNLSAERQEALTRFLTERSYSIYTIKGDRLAVNRKSVALGIYLKLLQVKRRIKKWTGRLGQKDVRTFT